jgi:hypothetical protein
MRRTARGDSRRRTNEALDCVIPAERPQFTFRDLAMLQEIDTRWWCTYRRAQNLESPTTQRKQNVDIQSVDPESCMLQMLSKAGHNLKEESL